MTKVPAVPSPTDDNLREVVRAVKGVLDVREGLLGSPEDRFVTLRELNEVSASISSAASSSSVTSSTVGAVIPIGEDDETYDPTTDFTIPPAPENFSVTGLFASVKLDWSLPPILNYAYTEVWAADVNSIGEAVRIGTSATQMYVDYLGQSKGRYYWVRFVSEANVTGPYNDGNGTYGATAKDPALLIESLTNQITETELYQDLNTRINLIDAEETGLVTQVTNVKGKYSVKIDNAGHVTGFGLISTSNNEVPTSAFGVRADQFWIAPPAVNSIVAPTDNLYAGKVWVDESTSPPTTRYYDGVNWVTTATSLPFVVQAAPTVAPNDVAVPAGVYINSAFIKNASITEAQIGSVAADTIQAGYTSSVDLEASKFFGSEFYIGGTVKYKYGDAQRKNRKTGIDSVSSPSVAINSTGADFTVDFFRIKTSASATASPVFEVVGNDVRMKQALVRGLAVVDAEGKELLSAGTKLDFSYIDPDEGWLNSNLANDISAAKKAGDDAQVTADAAATAAANAQDDATTANNALPDKLSKAGDEITGRINLTVADGLFAGTDLNNGCYFGSGGIFGKKDGVTNFYVDSSGNAGFSGTLNVASASTGERMEITNESIEVYDSGGRLRVKIGRL